MSVPVETYEMSQQEAVATVDETGQKRWSNSSGDTEGPIKDGCTESTTREDGRIELRQEDCYEQLGFGFSTWKKWKILCVIFIVQVSMNFNASTYGNTVAGLTESFHISKQAARLGQMVFLIAYAFGCELWAPWSEEFGRRLILQLSLLFVNLWQIPCALAPNFATIIVCRGLGGLSSAGGSVTLGLVADMWEPAEQGYAVAFVVLSSVGGSVVGPIVGGFMEKFLSWRWNFWIQLIFGAVTQILHFCIVPETRASLLVDVEAKKRRKAGQENVYGPGELKVIDRGSRMIPMKEVLQIWGRPFYMFLCEPIVLFLSLLSGFSDALIFTFLESYKPVYRQWGFGTIAIGLAFVPIGIGYIIAYFSFFPFIRKNRAITRRDGSDALQPEARLYWLLWTAPLEAIGLFGFAWTSLGPAHVHWIAPMIFSSLVGIANYAIYMATIDYMVAAYGPYAASATGGNGFARDFLAGIAALYAVPLYHNIGNKYHLEWASTLLGGLAVVVTIPIFLFYRYGPQIRARSKFASKLEGERKERDEKHVSGVVRREEELMVA